MKHDTWCLKKIINRKPRSSIESSFTKQKLKNINQNQKKTEDLDDQLSDLQR
uniref:Uncharacterized protein n=1 Tax=Salix viminalis TaxID=40686 RepID=A0A6N2N0X3_SALVM